MVFDVFISYPHQDKAMADAACAKLEAEGIRCWMAPRDIAPGANWAASIVDAIDGCRIMVLIFSGHTNRSKQVSREVQQAFDAEKPVLPFRIENVAPESSLRYYMGSVHWLDALTRPVEQHLARLVSAVQALLQARPEAEVRRTADRRPVLSEDPPHAARAEANHTIADVDLKSRPAPPWIWKAAAIAGLFVLLAGAIGGYLWWPSASSAYARVGNFACFDKAEYPDSWREEAPLCAPYGCNFGKLSRDACLALGVKKQSKTIIHGNPGTSRANECWLQHSCGDLRPHGEFTMFRM